MSARRINRRNLIAGGVATLVTVVTPLLVRNRRSHDDPELRVLRTDDRATALVADGRTRVLVVNSGDREAVRAALSRASRPWEELPRLLIAPSDDDCAVGLLEAIEHARPEAVLVAGVPGADPVWGRIDQLCRERKVPLHYITDMMTAETPRLRFTVIGAAPTDREPTRAALITREGTTVVVAFDAGAHTIPGQVLIADSDGEGVSADMLVTVNDAPRSYTRDQVLLGFGDVVRIRLSVSGVTITGGEIRRTSQ